MSVSRAEVDELALLARLELGDAESERLRTELSAMLDYVAQLAAVDTTGVEPMTHAVPMDLRLRPDEARPSLPGEAALAGAPQVRDGSFVVPNIIKTAADRE